MRNFFNFSVKTPLTFNLGHPVGMRIERLQHVESRGRKLPAMIGLSILMGSTISPVGATPSHIFVEAPATISSDPVQAAPGSDAPSTGASEPAQKQIVKLAENSLVDTLPSSRAASTQNLPPLYMIFMPELTHEHIAAMETGRQAYLSGQDKSASQLKAVGLSAAHFAMFELVVDNAGQGRLLIQRSFDPQPLQRPVSLVMEKSLSKIINRCVASGGPDHFKFNLETADSDLQTGPMTVRCWPGDKRTRATYTHVQTAEAWMGAEDFSLEQRKQMMRSKMSFAKKHDYVAAHPEPDGEAERAHCRHSIEETQAKYPFTKYENPEHDRQLKASCEERDYGWVRARIQKGISLIK